MPPTSAAPSLPPTSAARVPVQPTSAACPCRPSLPPISAARPCPHPCRLSLPPIPAAHRCFAPRPHRSASVPLGRHYLRADRLMQRSIRAGRCPDAPFSDAAAGACALASGVRQLLLPGTWLQNNPKRPFGAWPIGERLISYHRLPPHVATCWARHAQSGGADADAECEPCDNPVAV